MSKREALKQRRHQRVRRRQGAIVAATTLVAFVVIGLLIFQNARPIGDFVTIEKEALPYADGKALGLTDAPVVIQEFSDFQ